MTCKGHTALSVAFVLLIFPAMACADTIRVSFVVGGDNAATEFSPQIDPVFGESTAEGFFTFSSDLLLRPPSQTLGGGGVIIQDLRGLGADEISFVWGGVNWTRASADMYAVEYFSSERYASGFIGGFPAGFAGTNAATGLPDFGLSRYGFDYVNPEQPGTVFTGRTLSWDVSWTPTAATPEPATLLLMTTGLLLGWRRRSTR